jgi:SSS family solute:Na+ symporter
MGKLVLQAFYGTGKIESPAILAAIGDFNFLYFSGVLFLICAVTITLVSLSGLRPEADRIRGLTFASIDRESVRRSWNTTDVIATAVILSLVAALYLYFSFWIG